MTLPASVLLYLFEIKQSIDLEQRAAATDDQAWSVIGANSPEGYKQLQQRIATLESLAAGQSLATAEAPGAIQL